MLSACGGSPARPAISPDPIERTRTVVKAVCPAEVTAPSPGAVPDYAGPAIVVPREFLDWQAAHLRREGTLDARLADARKACP